MKTCSVLLQFQLLTTRGQAGAGGPVVARLVLACVRVENAAELELRQFHHLCVLRAFVLQRKLSVVQHDGVQAALESLTNARVLLRGHQAARVRRLHLVSDSSQETGMKYTKKGKVTSEHKNEDISDCSVHEGETRIRSDIKQSPKISSSFVSTG